MPCGDGVQAENIGRGLAPAPEKESLPLAQMSHTHSPHFSSAAISSLKPMPPQVPGRLVERPNLTLESHAEDSARSTSAVIC